MDSNAFDISVIRIWNVCSADSYCGSSTECVSYSVLSFVQSPEETQVEFWLLIWVFEVRTLGNLCWPFLGMWISIELQTNPNHLWRLIDFRISGLEASTLDLHFLACGNGTTAKPEVNQPNFPRNNAPATTSQTFGSISCHQLNHDNQPNLNHVKTQTISDHHPSIIEIHPAGRLVHCSWTNGGPRFHSAKFWWCVPGLLEFQMFGR